MLRKRVFLAATVLVWALAGVGCFENTRLLTDRDVRISRAGRAWSRYSPKDQELIRKGRFRNGLDEYALYLARGAPVLYWDTLIEIEGRRCRVLIYDYWSSEAKENRPTLADLAVYTCNKIIVGWRRIQPALPCWRLNEVGPRIDEHLTYFSQLPLRRQWELVAGVLRRGQTPLDLEIAFGKPYNTGVEAREDGTNATTQVYLDSTGDAYGLYTTFVNGRLVGWRIPAERKLTPEAQARRLKAMENRLMAQLRAMEARSIKRHQEQMQLLHAIQANQETMMDTLSTLGPSPSGQPNIPLVGRAVSGVVRRQVDKARTHLRFVVKRTKPRQAPRLHSVNGKTFYDRPGSPMGRKCGIGYPACPTGYYCYHLVAGIKSHGRVTGMEGRCMPTPKAARQGAFAGQCRPGKVCPDGFVCFYSNKPKLKAIGRWHVVPLGRCVRLDPPPK